MWRFRKQSYSAVALAISFASVSGCSLSSSRDDSSIHVDLSSLQSQRHQLALGLSASGSFLNGLTAPPSSAANFSCYAVNITGPGIGDSGNHNGGPGDDVAAIFPPLWNETSYCSYRGVVTPTINLDGSGSADVALQVPPGDQRLVQVVGINDTAICASGVVDDPPGTNGGGSGRFFEIGRAKLAGVFTDRSVSIGMNWPATTALQSARAMDCGGGSSQTCTLIKDYTTGGTAAILAITSPTVVVAQAIPYVPGAYINTVSMMLSNVSAPSSTDSQAIIYIYSSTSQTNMSGATYTGYSSAATAVTVYANSAAQVVSFNMEDPVNHFLMMQPGVYYWAVIASPNAANSTQQTFLQVHFGSDGTANTSTTVFQGSGNFPTFSWASQSGAIGIYSQVKACNN